MRFTAGITSPQNTLLQASRILVLFMLPIYERSFQKSLPVLGVWNLAYRK